MPAYDPPAPVAIATEETKVKLSFGGRYTVSLYPRHRDFELGEWLELRGPDGRVVLRETKIRVYSAGYGAPVHDLSPGEYLIVPSDNFVGAFAYSFIRK
jgi:hypothetical protein